MKTEKVEIEHGNMIAKLRKDLRDAAKLMTKEEARFTVDLYYEIQDFRKATANQIRSMGKEPTAILQWSFESMETIESEIRVALDKYTDNEETGMGRWCKAIVGIGPVLSAGLLAHIDLEPWKCNLKATNGGEQCSENKPHPGGQCKRQPINTVGAIWRFAGLDPTVKWNKGEKRPWNAKLKVLCWLIGQSFVKVSGNEKSLYGRLYRERKQLEVQKSEKGEYAEQAKEALANKKFGKDTAAYAAYKEGKFPAGRLDLRATRYAVKILLYHFFAESYRRKWGKEAPMPWVISHGGHTDFIGPEK